MTHRLNARFARWLPSGGFLLAALLCLSTLRADETVRQVQEELRKRNLYFGDIDGQKTPQISAALVRYQKRKGFTATGEPDDTTLRSLHLLPALPLVAARDGASSPPPSAAADTPWPDITVLRSDEARRVPSPPGRDNTATAADVSPSPTLAPGTPPAAVATRSWPTVDAVRAFLTRYLQAGQTNDAEAELAFYADHVDYFNEGVVDRRFIRGDVSRYDRRWPQRQFTLLEPLTLADSPDGDPEKFVARFRLAFANKSARYSVQGKVDDTFIFQRTGPESFRIVGMKEQRVREE